MRSKTYLNHLWIGLLIFFSVSCQKDDLNEDSKENLTNTAEWTFSSGYVTVGATYFKNKEIEVGASYVDVKVDVTKAGTYNLSTDTINGYYFSGSGSLEVKEEGEYQAVTLWASGTPLSSGDFEFKVSFGGSSADFKTKVLPFDATTELESKIIISGTYDEWNEHGDLTAYQAATGEVVWSVPVSGHIGMAEVKGDTIFHNNSDYLEARNILTGELYWAVTHTKTDGFNSSYSGITYSKGVLYCSTNDGHVLAFKSSDGSILRDFDLGTSSVVSSIPVISDDVMFVGHDYLWAFHTDGSLKWKYQLPALSRSGATVDNGLVYISTDNGELCAVNISDGTLKWKYFVGTTGHECPTVINGRIYSGNTNLYCLNAVSGQLIWQKDDLNFGWNSPNVFDNIIYVTGDAETGGGVLRSINAETGSTIWETSTYSRSSEIAASEKFVVYYTAGLMARYAENGEIIWSNDEAEYFDVSTLDPIIYDKVTQEVLLTSIYGSKK